VLLKAGCRQRLYAVLILIVLPSVCARAQEPPVIPVGLDAYRMWDRWPQQRIGARAYMRSTYDRSGGNEGADASHFLYQRANDFNVSLDVAGPGILYFARYNHWHGSPWHYVVDGIDHLVQETSTADPNHPVGDSVFLPHELFPNPLALTWTITRGADLTWVPVPFERSFQMAYSRTHYGTGYYIYDQYVRGARLSRPIRSWDWKTPPDRDVLELIGRAGSDLAPRPGTPEGKKVGVREDTGELTLPAGESELVWKTTHAPSMLRALEFSVPRESALQFGRARLRVTWDGRPQPSIDAPVALFYGAGTLYNRDGREYLVRAFPVNVRFDDQRVHLACYFPMPFFRSARIELGGAGGKAISGIQWSVRYVPYRDPLNDVGYFHASYRDHPEPEPGKDLVLVDTRTTEGSSNWSGSFVGTSIIFSHRAQLSTLEGDPRFFFDDSQTPQAYGTGTEEWGGGGDYWGGLNMTLSFAGHPAGAPNAKAAKNDEDLIESAYRFLLADLMPFGKNALIRLEHGGENESTEHYETVTYWYGAPSASLIKTDELQIGDPRSEKAHRYVSPQASAPYEITSRYEWGVDTFRGKEVYPASTDRGRTTTGSSEFRLRLIPNNFGVLLRRKLDYSYPNQGAEVYVADATSARTQTRPAEWKRAGVWYLAGSNTCVYSNPKDEVGAAQHIVQTSNRRFRDDEFLIPRNLTRGRSAIKVRVKFKPLDIPLYPGAPSPKLAWSEIRYMAYCFVMPKVP
jgi:D-arabinan exo alpha-(1,3)/(1,5)-arabinofuranosidase (non-reducing end)